MTKNGMAGVAMAGQQAPYDNLCSTFVCANQYSY